MNSLETILYACAFSVSGFSLVLLLFCRRQLDVLSTGFVRLVAVLAVGLVFQTLLHAPDAPAKHGWMFLTIVQAFCLGPILLLYLHEVIEQRPVPYSRLGKALPGLTALGILAASPVLAFLHFDSGWKNAVFHPGDLFWSVYYNLSALYCMLYFSLAGWCLWRCHKLLRGDLPPLHAKANRLPPYIIRVLKVFFWGYTASVLLNAWRVLICHVYGGVPLINELQSVVDISLIVAILALSLSGLVKHAVISSPGTELREEDANYIASKPGTTKSPADINTGIPASTGSPKKYQRSALDEASRLRIKGKLDEAFASPSLFTRSDLTLGKLARHVGEQYRYVSQVINQDLASTFFTLLNQARVKYATDTIRQNPEAPMVEVAQTAGFNSKSTFYSAFVKFVGVTPAQYRKNVSAPHHC